MFIFIYFDRDYFFGHNQCDGKVVSVTDCNVKRRMFEPHMHVGF